MGARRSQALSGSCASGSSLATSPCELPVSRTGLLPPLTAELAARTGRSKLLLLLLLLRLLLLRLMLPQLLPSMLPLHWLQPLAPSPWGGIGGREVGRQRQERRSIGHSGGRHGEGSSCKAVDRAIWGDLEGIVGVLRTGTCKSDSEGISAETGLIGSSEQMLCSLHAPDSVGSHWLAMQVS